MAQQEKWELYYWRGTSSHSEEIPSAKHFLGRGEFVRLMFEEMGIPYIEPEIETPGTVLKMMQDGRTGKLSYPAFAPPIIKRGNFVLNQTHAILRYLGHKYDYCPETEEDIAHADSINLAISDFIGEGRQVFHPKEFMGTYYKQQEEAKPYVKWFEDERLEKHMLVLEHALKANKEGKEFFFGDKCTYIDVAAYHVMAAAESQFPEAYKRVDTPIIKAHKERMEKRPNIAAYLASERRGCFEGNSMM